jgi:hypothetical protein
LGLAALLVALVGLRARSWDGVSSAPEDRAGERIHRFARGRFFAGIEVLRESRYFGAAVDDLWPRRSTMGRISTIRVIRGP